MIEYSEVIDYLFQQLPMYQRQGKIAFKKNLDNILKMVEYLENPQLKYPTIHIAGTNGKGSTAHLISAAFQANGYKTGLYTSPHYVDFRERIKVNGHLISKNEVIEFVEKNKKAFQNINPSFFEWTVALAFHHFAKKNVDIAIIETGLGGRLDSTNIISPLLSIITNIDFDHQAMLGNTIEEIAFEKAGIIKKNIPVLIGRSNLVSNKVFEERATKFGSEIFYADKIVNVSTSYNKVSFLNQYTISYGEEKLKGKIDLSGPHNIENIRTAFSAIRIIKNYTKFEINESTFFKSLSSFKKITNYRGRWEILMNKPLIIADSAHNEDGLRKSIDEVLNKKKNLHFVLGFVNDKDVKKVLELFPQNSKYYFAKPDIPRGLSIEKLRNISENHFLNTEYFDSIKLAIEKAIKSANKNDLIYIGGSTFVVAEALTMDYKTYLQV